MSSSRKGKRVAVILAGVIGIGFPLVIALAWPHIYARYQFWRRFEALGRNEQDLPEYRHRTTGIVMVRVPSGRFWMGAQKEEPTGRNFDPAAAEDEGPVHEVTLSAFLIAKYELTQSHWQAVMSNNPSLFQSGDLPVEQVSWDDIQEFEAKVGLALPTEAQWEYACRGGGTGVYCFGDDTERLQKYSWYGAASGETTHPVGRKFPNGFGLHDMHGNVWEWCEDVYDAELYSRAEARGPDPLCTSGSGGRVGRGGYWRDHAVYCRSAIRRGLFPTYRSSLLGFRPAAPCP